MAKPGISVVVATHNRPRFLERAVASLQAQTYTDFELWIVDDASTAETAETVARLAAEDDRIHGLRCDENLGPGGARNRGIAAARADAVAILDDDDLCRPHRLETQLDVLRRRPEIDLVCSAVQWIDRDEKPLSIWPGVLDRGELPEDPRELFRLLYLESNKIPNTTILARTETLRRFPYAEDLRVGEDWYACMQMAASGLRFAGISEPLVLQMRDPDHESLMAGKERAFADQRRALKNIRAWLGEQGVREYDGLHRRAWTHQLVREARFLGGVPGLRRTATALVHSPGNGEAWSCLGTLLGRGWAKIRSKMGSGR